MLELSTLGISKNLLFVFYSFLRQASIWPHETL